MRTIYTIERGGYDGGEALAAFERKSDRDKSLKRYIRENPDPYGELPRAGELSLFRRGELAEPRTVHRVQLDVGSDEVHASGDTDWFTHFKRSPQVVISERAVTATGLNFDRALTAARRAITNLGGP